MSLVRGMVPLAEMMIEWIKPLLAGLRSSVLRWRAALVQLQAASCLAPFHLPRAASRAAR